MTLKHFTEEELQEIQDYLVEKGIDTNTEGATLADTDKIPFVRENASGEDEGGYHTVEKLREGRQVKSNLVTAFQPTPDDTHYPSEKLVYDSVSALNSSISSEVSALNSSISSEAATRENAISAEETARKKADDTKLNLSGGTMTGDISSQNVVPTADDTYNLGSSSKSFLNAYITNCILNGVDVESAFSFTATQIATLWSNAGGDK